MINSSVISRKNEQVLAHFLITCHQLLRGSWRRRQQVCKEVTRKLMMSRGSYKELVPVEFDLYANSQPVVTEIKPSTVCKCSKIRVIMSQALKVQYLNISFVEIWTEYFLVSVREIWLAEYCSTSHVLCRNTLSRALDSMKQETEKMADVHADLSAQLSSAAQRMTEFNNRQKAEIRTVWLAAIGLPVFICLHGVYFSALTLSCQSFLPSFMVALWNRADHIYFHAVVCYGRPMK